MVRSALAGSILAPIGTAASSMAIALVPLTGAMEPTTAPIDNAGKCAPPRCRTCRPRATTRGRIARTDARASPLQGRWTLA